MKSKMGILTGDADVSFAALGGPCGAPSHTLTPEVLGPKQLLHLLTCDLYAGFSYHQACENRWKASQQRRGNTDPAPPAKTARWSPPCIQALKCCAPLPGSVGRQRRYQILMFESHHRLWHGLIMTLCCSVWHWVRIKNVWARALWRRILGIMANPILFANSVDCRSFGSLSPNKTNQGQNKHFLPTAVSPGEKRLRYTYAIYKPKNWPVLIMKHCLNRLNFSESLEHLHPHINTSYFPCENLNPTWVGCTWIWCLINTCSSQVKLPQLQREVAPGRSWFQHLSPCSALWVLFTGLTFVCSLRACVTYQQSRKTLSHSNYLQLLPESHPLCFHTGVTSLPTRWCLPKSQLSIAIPFSFAAAFPLLRRLVLIVCWQNDSKLTFAWISRLKHAHRSSAEWLCVHGNRLSELLVELSLLNMGDGVKEILLSRTTHFFNPNISALIYLAVK